jgi:hypothetical protein
MERVHDVLTVALIVLRPLIWSGDASSWDNLAYVALITVSGLSLVWEGLLGWRRSWRWSSAGCALLILWLVLGLAAVRSPMPSAGWGVWGMLGMDVVLAYYLMQTLPARTRLAFGAVIAGLTIESLVAVLQHLWVIPHMRDALEHGDAAVSRYETSHSDLAERLERGGVFGTFTLANTLAGYLLLAVPVLMASLVRAGCQWWVRAAGVLVFVLALIAAAETSSKGAVLALVCAAALLAVRIRDGWRRLLTLAACVLVTGLCLAVLPWRSGLLASAEVRWGYWQGALTLIRQAPWTGYGLSGFATRSAHAMPLSAEPTRYVHNEILEAWCDGGILAAITLLALLALVVLARRAEPTADTSSNTSPGTTSDPTRARLLWASAPLVVLFPFFCALGMLQSNLAWWPGGGESGWTAWVFALAALTVIATLVGARLPPPPAWAWRLAILGLALHCLIDFDLHSPGVCGCLIITCCLAGGPARTWPLTAGRLAGASVIAIAAIVALAIGMHRALQLGEADLLCERLAVPTSGAGAGAGYSSDALADQLGLPTPGPGDPVARQRIRDLAFARLDNLAEAWPPSFDLALSAVALQPPGAERLHASEQLALRIPESGPAHAVLAQDLARCGRFDEAIAAMRTAVHLAPADLARRIQLARLLDDAADHAPLRAAALHAAAEQERQTLSELMHVVHPRNLP